MNRWIVALLLSLALGSSYLLDGPIDDGAEVIAADLNEVTNAAVVATKD